MSEELFFVVCTRVFEHCAQGCPTLEIRLYAKATSTPKTRVYIQSSDEILAALADELGVSVWAVRHWCYSERIHYGSHARENLLATLSPSQEAIVIKLRPTEPSDTVKAKPSKANELVYIHIDYE